MRSFECECGCGEPVGLAKETNRRHGHVKGQPLRFVAGHNSRRKPIAERLWARTKIVGECWEWTGTRHPDGYGGISIKEGDRVRRRPVHRVAWQLEHGPIPNGLCVCHRCDNPPCWNPRHLFLGTLQDNHADMWAKGRGFVPEARPGQPRRKAA